MKIQTKLFAGIFVVILLFTGQGILHWQHSSNTQRDVDQFEHLILRQFHAADQMMGALAKLEAHILDTSAPDLEASARNQYVGQGAGFMGEFGTNLDKAIRVSQAGESLIKSEGDPREQVQHLNQAERLKSIDACFREMDSHWQEFARVMEATPVQASSVREGILIPLIHQKLRPILVEYTRNLDAQMLRELHQIFAKSQASNQQIMLIAALIALGGTGVIIFLTKLLLQPLSELINASRDVAGGNRQRRLLMNRSDEFGIMARTFNEMLDTIQATSISQGELEEAIRRSNAEIDGFFRSAADAMCIGNFEGKLLRINPSFAKLFGYTEEEFLSIAPESNLHPHDLPIFQRALRDLVSDQARSVEFEVRGRTRDGSWVSLSWKAVAAPDLRLIYGTARDVTELRQTTEALRASQRNLSITLNSIGDGVLVTDAEARVTRLNPVAERLTGWTSMEAEGRPAREVFVLVDEESRQPLAFPITAVLANGGIVNLPQSALLLSRDGHAHPIADSCASILDPVGSVIGAILVFRDVTSERAAETELRERETMLRQLANNLPSGATYRLIESHDGDVRFQYISDGIEHLTGVPKSAILEDSRRLFGLIPQEDLSRMEKAGEMAQLNFGQLDCETRLGTAGSEERWVQWRALPHRLSATEIAWDGLLVDITPLKVAEHQLRQTNDHLEITVYERTAALSESERRHRTLLANLQGMAYRCRNDADWTMEYLSPGSLELLGVAPEILLSGQRTFESFIHPEDRERVRHEVQVAITEKRPFALEYRIRHANEKWCWVWDHGRALFDDQGNLEALEGFVADITARKQAEEAVSVQERWLSSLFRALPAGVGVVGNRIVSQVNERFCDMSGYASEELIGRSTRILYPSEEEFQAVGHDLYELVRTRNFGSVECRWRRKSGELFEVLISASPIDATDPMVVTLVVTDISLLKRAEAKIRMLSQAVEQSPVSIMITDTQGNIEYVNPRFTQLTGYSSGEVLGKNPRFLRSGETSPMEYERLWRKITSGQDWRGQFLNLKKNGEPFWEISSISAIRDERGSITHFLAVKEDITERRRTQERLREQAALLDQTQDAILVLGKDRQIRYFNRAAEQLYASLTGGTSDQPADPLLFPGEPLQCAEAFAKTLEKGAWSGEVRHFISPGKFRIVQNRWTAIRDAKGQHRDFLVVNTDITEKKRLEEQFLRAQRMESVGTLASGVAHDLNNVLSPILMAIDLLRPMVQKSEEDAMLNMLKTGVQRGAGIVKQLLTFGRGVEGQRSELQTRTLLKEMAKVIRETFPKSITLREVLPEDLWTIHADSTQIHQVILNLCVNARDAMPRGGELNISAENVILDIADTEINPDAKPGPYIVLQVADSGTGIPPELLDKIFDPFFTTKEPGKGTGLGLSTVMGIVRSHGGFVQVNSCLGQGTGFKVFLPALEQAKSHVRMAEPSKAPRGEGQYILVVDDEEPVREIARRMLERNGYQVLTASDGAAGLVLYLQRKDVIQALVTDMIMPVMDGGTFIRVLRNYSRELPIVAMSGLATQQEEAARPESRADAFLHKPFSSSDILAALNRVLAVAKGGYANSSCR